jgi:thiol-disulfide isomerase/thioredoxin
MTRPFLSGRLLLAAVLAGAAAIGAVVALRSAHAPAPAAGPGEEAAGAALYALALEDADGHKQALSQWKGKRLLVNFWATWCTPCVAEMPDLERLQQEFAGRNVAVIGIGIENREKVRQFRDRLGLRMTLLAGGYDSLALARAFGDVQGVLPYTALFSPDGQLLQTQTGALLPGQVRSWLTAGP